MNVYTLKISEQAKKDLKQIDRYQARLITNWLLAHIDQSPNPRIHGKALTGSLGNFWRYRVGNYRVICEIKDKDLIVLAVNIGHRKDIYD